MRVDWLKLVDFRSYRGLEWSPDPGVNLMIGPNGAGKTNLLEAIAYLSTLRSFRSVPDAALVRRGADAGVIRAGIGGDERDRLIEIELSASGQKRVQVDKTRLRRSGDLLGVIRVITFLPDDLDLVKRGPAGRRDLLDEIAVQLWPSAHLDQIEFERALRQRNAFLKAGDRDDTTLSVWDSRLAHSGGRVVARRMRVIETLAELLDHAYREISQQAHGAEIIYQASWTSLPLDGVTAAEHSQSLTEALGESRRADYERRVTTVGPHRDEPSFMVADRDARTLASQGEQRSVALAIKLAAHRAVATAVGEPPVLLLDDVFSELDPGRSEALAKTLPGEAQAVITSARPDDVPLGGSVWRVDGEIGR